MGPCATLEASVIRPLASKNADAKAIAGSVARAMRDNLSRESHPAQRGFVPGRGLSKSAIELDAYARALAAKAPPDDVVVLLLLDIEAAFPSMRRQYMRMATRAHPHLRTPARLRCRLGRPCSRRGRSTPASHATGSGGAPALLLSAAPVSAVPDGVASPLPSRRHRRTGKGTSRPGSPYSRRTPPGAAF